MKIKRTNKALYYGIFVSIVTLFILSIYCYAQEELQLTFDGRVWSIGYQAQTRQGSIIEYVLGGETVNNWTELVTVQVFPGMQKNTTVENFMAKTKENLKSQCPSLSWRILSKKENDIIYEWGMTGCSAEENRHAIARIISGGQGIYFMHYLTKKIPIPTKMRKKWIRLIKSATLTKPLENKKEKIINNVDTDTQGSFYSTT